MGFFFLEENLEGWERMRGGPADIVVLRRTIGKWTAPAIASAGAAKFAIC
jgi:hypothetical protein